MSDRTFPRMKWDSMKILMRAGVSTLIVTNYWGISFTFVIRATSKCFEIETYKGLRMNAFQYDATKECAIFQPYFFFPKGNEG